jgi:hypothetical protein
MSVHRGRIFTSQIVGPHRIELESPDLVHVHYHGDVELEHFHGFDTVMAVMPMERRLYLLRNAHNGGTLAPETRKHIASLNVPHRFAAVATYGASFQSKTVFTNLGRALKTIRPDSTVPSDYFDDENDARSWLDVIRQHLDETR